VGGAVVDVVVDGVVAGVVAVVVADVTIAVVLVSGCSEVDDVSSFEPHAERARAAARPVNDAVTVRAMSDLDV